MSEQADMAELAKRLDGFTVFITSREKIKHPEGAEYWAETKAAIQSRLRSLSAENHLQRQSIESQKYVLEELRAEITRQSAEIERLREANPVIQEISDERSRQIQKEGWTAAHDDKHANGDMAAAAACYALNASLSEGRRMTHPAWWPWSLDWWKPKSPRRDLVRAAALIVAEIERLDRAAQADSED